ncbi:MAG: S9 family peptidase [Gemmatimonadota bacterium]
MAYRTESGHSATLRLLCLLAAGLVGCGGSEGETEASMESSVAMSQHGVAEREPRAPRAARRPVKLEAHGHIRVDDYYWLRERENPEVLAYLEAENAYTDAVMAPTRALREKLFQEIKGRIKQADMSVPYRKKGYYYYSRFEEGKEYAVYARRRGSTEAPEEVMLDGNRRAEGHDFFAVRGVEVSPDNRTLAFAEDTVGRRIYTLRFRDLETGELLPDEIPTVTGNVAWANDGRTLFYARQDPVTLRSYQIWRHVLGEDPERDPLVYEEPDETFRCFVSKTKSDAYLMIVSTQTLATEVRYLSADDPAGEFRVLLPRKRGHEYRADHLGDHFYLRTNDGARNFRLVRVPVARPTKENWEEVIPHREDALLEGFELFREHLVAAERRDGLLRLRIRRWSDGDEHYVNFGEPAYSAFLQDNEELDTGVLRFVYTSLTTPRSVYDYDMESREKTLLKREEVLGGFDPADYVTERLRARARGGAAVPISLVYRRGARREGGNPLLLVGYGSYGFSLDAAFASPRLSLLDRGFVYAIAHVRGGEELGRRWYEEGKLLKKKNTFTDFIDVAEHLVQEGYTRPEKLYAMGGSAGGLLMGTVANLRPDLFHGIVAHVPFVDVVTTMLDESIPLTTNEYDEWGDPNDEEYYRYILSYSPYDNVTVRAYPHLLVTTGLHDSQVQYWEPAKWVAKLRSLKTDDHRLLLKTTMEAGHGGPSGRYRRYRETAFDYAFLLDLEGVGE